MVLLTYNIDPNALVEEFTRKGAISAIKEGIYDPETEKLSLSFKDEEIVNIATAQLDLVKRDLEVSIDEVYFDDENYKEALEFVRTKEFASCCQIATGVSFEQANEFGEYLARRYSRTYKQALSDCLKLIKPEMDVSSTEFAYELAVFLFETRLTKNRNQSFVESELAWKTMRSFGVKVHITKRQYEFLYQKLAERCSY
ncbi:hypothetical protein UA32_12095 [Photobacterium angustum]|uniref:Uncharacterized protein n=1 Tax=Photobacterium angustum TaxID=661 RepID=A0ABX5GZ91_PHOAN|nr:hypothetical protein [Photobacterium angustum]KJG37698.1 hypothetical protein UA32_12095 [Photobacterium angustum]PSX03971.1 hypothetical protein C0W27_20980 [Photobacterium angustum]